MTIRAKYRGTCWVCDGAIEPGDVVDWTKGADRGQTVRHATCNPTPSEPEPEKASSFLPTAEQAETLRLARLGVNLAIEAGAGTGKTSTLVLLAQDASHRGLRGQYIAFNNRIVREGEAKFEPLNCSAKTAHALARRATYRRFRDKPLGGRLKSSEVATMLGIDPLSVTGPFGPKYLSAARLAGIALRAVRAFCQSADLAIGPEHVPYVNGIDRPGDDRNNRRVAAYLAPFLRDAWADLMSPEGALPFTHDHYLKAWHLSGPRIDADYILFDECQDANPVMLAIVEAQDHAQRIYVGDSQQQIYSFTGAVNALGRIRDQGGEVAFLTQSFRFGTAIADVANVVLGAIPAAELRLKGHEPIRSSIESIREPDAILTRTNATAVREVLELQKDGVKVALVGEGRELVMFAEAARDLRDEGWTSYPDLACFESWDEVLRYVDEDEAGSDLRLNVRLIEEFGIPTILDALSADRRIPLDEADVIVSTAHKAKGLEWDSVRLASDFPGVDPDSGELPDDEELRLLYVAVTRARRRLDVSAVHVLSEIRALALGA